MLKFYVVNPKVGPLRSHSCDWSVALTLGATTSDIKGSHTSIRSLVCSVLPLQHKICVFQVTTKHCGNLAMRLRVSSLCNTIQLSLLSGCLRWSTDERRCKSISYPLAANFAFGVAPCSGIVEPFKLFLRVTAHLLFWCLSCERPWALARDKTVIYSMQIIHVYS